MPDLGAVAQAAGVTRPLRSIAELTRDIIVVTSRCAIQSGRCDKTQSTLSVDSGDSFSGSTADGWVHPTRMTTESNP